MKNAKYVDLDIARLRKMADKLKEELEELATKEYQETGKLTSALLREKNKKVDEINFKIKQLLEQHSAEQQKKETKPQTDK